MRAAVGGTTQAKRQTEHYTHGRERTHLLFLYSPLCQVSAAENPHLLFLYSPLCQVSAAESPHLLFLYSPLCQVSASASAARRTRVGEVAVGFQCGRGGGSLCTTRLLNREQTQNVHMPTNLGDVRNGEADGLRCGGFVNR